MEYDNSMSEDMREYLLDEIKLLKPVNIAEKNNFISNNYIIEADKNIIKGIEYCVSLSQGATRNMEDRYIVDTFLGNPIFILLDGHKGSYVSDFCKKNIMRLLTKHKETVETDSNIVEYFKNIFNKLITELEDNLNQYSLEHNSGSTITIVYLLQNYIISTNLGNTKSLLIKKDFQFIELTEDHNPYIPLEKKRITKAHGSIINNKINNNIPTSRSLGDFQYKNQKHLKNNEQLVSNVPYILEHRKQNNEKYILIATNSIWENFTNQKIVDYISNSHNIYEIFDIQKISKNIIEHSFKIKNNENATIIMIKLS